MLVFVLPLVLIASHVTEASLTIGAFNIQRMSDNKVHDPKVLSEIAQILVRFDVVSIEEVLHESAMQVVLAEANKHGGPYSVTMSPAMGRTSYKEHLAIMYRSDKVTLRNAVTYPDTADAFEREPYTALFHTTQASVHDFALMGVHLKPADVVKEMNALVHAFEYASQHLGTQNFLIAGDYNADCSYLTATNYQLTGLATDPRFTFLVDSAADTTASHNTNCAYDRFVATGAMRAASGGVTVYNFETGLHLTYTDALAVSDHYPIQMTLQ